MMLSEVLKNQNLILSSRGIEMMVFAIKQILPNYYLSATNQKLSSEWMVRNIMKMDLPEDDVLKIIQHMCRLGKIWAFS